MAVTAETARRAIKRWELEGGRAVTTSICACVYWSRPDPVQPLLHSSRLVHACKEHRPPWLAGMIRADP